MFSAKTLTEIGFRSKDTDSVTDQLGSVAGCWVTLGKSPPFSGPS